VLTIQYGEWSPDLANVSFQIPDQEGPVIVPVADCLNVYYQDGAYRTLPGPASIGPALGFQCLNATTWYDLVNQKEAIFAAGTNAISELVDGAWSAVPISAGRQLLNGTITPATSGANVGYSTAGPYGSLTPAADINNNVVGLINQENSPTLGFTLTLKTANLGANYFATIAFPSLGVSLPASSATYSTSSFTTLLNTTVTPALFGIGNQDTGYQLSPAEGTISSGTDSNGNVVALINQFVSQIGSGQFFTFTLNTASLGATYFSTLQIPSLGITLLASSATYSTGAGQSSWQWNTYVPWNAGTAYNVLITAAGAGPQSTWTWPGITVPLAAGVAQNVVITAPAPSGSLAATFWSLPAQAGGYLAAIPFTQNGQATGPFLWSNQGGSNSNFVRPAGAPGCRVGATVSQFLMLGDLFQSQQQLLFTGNGSQTSYSGFLATPMLAAGTISDQQSALSGVFSNGNILPGGLLSSGTVDYANGAISLQFSSAVANGDQVFANYTQWAPYRIWWSAIGNPLSWPTPLTNAALAAQSGYNDLEAGLGQVMFISGYPLYAVIFQATGITRASYIGGNVVFSWQTYERKRGLVAHGAAVQVGANTYFLSDSGFFSTDGANVVPIGTASDNSAGIDNWFWANVNLAALEAIRSGYDGIKRCVMFAIPTGSNTLPDTLLIYPILSGKWTRAQIAMESVWTADNGADGSPGTRQTLGLFTLAHVPNQLTSTAPSAGYLESCDLSFADGNTRFTPQVRPNIDCTDTPSAAIGIRNSLQSAVTYSTLGLAPDPFAAGFVPTLAQRALYTRIRVSSGAASALNGATAKMRKGGPLG
jgi:hypothetical protein